MTFEGLYKRITGRLSRKRIQAETILADNAKGRFRPWEFRFIAEALLSNLWLDWNAFVKQTFILSCNGSITRTGATVLAREALDNSESRITYEMQQYIRGRNASPNTMHNGSIEPTWAHPDRIITCINKLAPSNTLTLRLAFGSAGLVGPKRIHLVRNACAHKTKENRADVLKLRNSYITNHYLDPIDIIWGSNPTTNSIAIFEWIEDLEDISNLATQ